MTECSDWMQKTLIAGEAEKQARLAEEAIAEAQRVKDHAAAISKATGIPVGLLVFKESRPYSNPFFEPNYIHEACGLMFSAGSRRYIDGATSYYVSIKKPGFLQGWHYVDGAESTARVLRKLKVVI